MAQKFLEMLLVSVIPLALGNLHYISCFTDVFRHCATAVVDQLEAKLPDTFS